MTDEDLKPELLMITELGGYPDFSSIYQRAGFKTVQIHSVRKAIRELKKLRPAVIVAEFNYQSDFRDRTSSLESLMAVLQKMPGTETIIFFEKEFEHQLQRLTVRFPAHICLPFPIETQKLETAVAELAAQLQN
ncbi:hypothetical protein MNBD_GAMMA24-2440 [hydrothermal vent metagenome]|uniref:Response regulatory domain-containing protein n=1 Tax=hydrothermal vent metagenome TaxID=652676 RepID=A0A3B1BZQ8_9ZZZZ